MSYGFYLQWQKRPWLFRTARRGLPDGSYTIGEKFVSVNGLSRSLVFDLWSNGQHLISGGTRDKMLSQHLISGGTRDKMLSPVTVYSNHIICRQVPYSVTKVPQDARKRRSPHPVQGVFPPYPVLHYMITMPERGRDSWRGPTHVYTVPSSLTLHI